MSCDIINILDLIDTVGESAAQAALSEFSCLRNKEFETFVKDNAIDFARRKISMTHLLFDDDGYLLGVFALTHKPLWISGEGLSKTVQNKLKRFSVHDDKENVFVMSAFLIAQFGKNSSIPCENAVTGDFLMECAMTVLGEVQHEIGGGVVFLECENKPKLISFYSKNGFTSFGKRHSEKENVTYIQFYKLF